MERKEEAEKRADYRAGVVAALFANAFRGMDTTVRQPHDFFPSLIPSIDDRSTADAQIAYLKSVWGPH